MAWAVDQIGGEVDSRFFDEELQNSPSPGASFGEIDSRCSAIHLVDLQNRVNRQAPYRRVSDGRCPWSEPLSARAGDGRGPLCSGQCYHLARIAGLARACMGILVGLLLSVWVGCMGGPRLSTAIFQLQLRNANQNRIDQEGCHGTERRRSIASGLAFLLSGPSANCSKQGILEFRRGVH